MQDGQRVNYRHAFHAGNHADVFKHALWVALVRSYQRKDSGFLALDTHAGRGGYDLERASRGETLARQPEWPEGIGRLWSESSAPEPIADYLDLIRRHDRARGNLLAEPRFYPGSPRITRMLARDQDRLAFWEKHPEEKDALQHEFRNDRRVTVTEGDGYVSLRALLPPPERRSLVLIDPPFESFTEWDDALSALAEGLRRHAAATLALWYPLTSRSEPRTAALGRMGVTCLTAELCVDPEADGMRGSGVAVLNPPWKFEAAAKEIADYLAPRLAKSARAWGSVRWLATE
jgi:23S rRNA (adenine2030-N6)-methyltransferase